MVKKREREREREEGDGTIMGEYGWLAGWLAGVIV